MFETTDLHVAAFLVCRGRELSRISYDGIRCVFSFSAPAVREDVEAFYRNAPAPAQGYATAIRNLKRGIHREKQQK